MSQRHYFCPICPSSKLFQSYSTLFVHIREEHREEPSFTVRCELSELCGSRYASFDSYRRHIYRCYRSLIDAFDINHKDRLDTDDNTIERQPKTAVILAIERQHNGQTQFAFQERLKNPYFGFWGLPSGKIRWGETVLETAQREALEETGLSADFRVAGVYHEQVKLEDGDETVEDKIFFVCHGTNPRGELLADFEGGHNEWMTFEQASQKDKKFDSFKMEIDILAAKDWLIERTANYTKQNF